MSSTIAKKELPSVDHCGYCMQTISRMVDPRKLPCSHIFCLHCMLADDNNGGGERFTCVSCRKTHSISSLKDLPTVNIIGSGEGGCSTAFITPIPCDLCQEATNKNSSIRYCTACEKTLCFEHLQMHEKYSNMFQPKSHLTISVEVYSSEPAKYRKEKCLTHSTEVVHHACSVCYTTFCVRCKIQQDCHGNDWHKIQNLRDVAQCAREKVRMGALRSLSEKIEEAKAMESKALKSEDRFQLLSKEMGDKIDQTARSQICRIEQDAAAIKSQILIHTQQCVRHVEDYTVKMIEKQEALESLWSTARDDTQNAQDADFLTQQRTSNLDDAANAVVINPCERLFNVFLESTESNQQQGLSLRLNAPLPTSLNAYTKGKGQCGALCWNKKGRLTLCCGNVVQVLEHDVRNVKTSVKVLNNATCSYITQMRNNNYIQVIVLPESSSSQDECQINIVDEYFALVKKLQKCNGQTTVTSNPFTSQLFLLKSHTIFVYNEDFHQLYSHNLDMKFPSQPAFTVSTGLFGSSSAVTQFVPSLSATPNLFGPRGGLFGSTNPATNAPNLPLQDNIEKCHLIPEENSLIICNPKASSVCKFNIKPDSTRRVWHTRIQTPTSLSSDSARYIYVASASDNTIYVLDNNRGSVVAKLNHKALTGVSIAEISVAGDMLAVACGKDGWMVFRIKRQDQVPTCQ